MAGHRGEVWWGPAPHKPGPAYRPWLVVSDDSHPFAHTECIGLGMTTTEHAEGIAVPDAAWVAGGSNVDSYISPWYVTTLKLRDLDNHQGTIDPELVTTAVEALHGYTPAVE